MPENPLSPADLEKHLSEEYKILCGIWDDFDRRTLAVKGWVAAGSLVAVAGFASNRVNDIALFVIAFLVAVFWLIEAMWKAWHHAYHDRLLEIEAYFRGNTLPPRPYQIRASWASSWNDGSGYWVVRKELLRPSVVVPYVPILIAIFALSFLNNVDPESGRCRSASEPMQTIE